MRKVYVVINTDHGWDNITGIFDPDEISFDQLKARFNSSSEIVMDWHYLQCNLDEYDA